MTNQDINDRDFWTWVAGFSDGEACFSVHHSGGDGKSYTVNYILTLRADDWRVLYYAQERSGLGYLRSITKTPPSNPQVSWNISGLYECMEFRDGILLGSGMASKKSRDFELWCKAIDLLAEHGGGIKSAAVPELAQIKAELHKVKEYDADAAEGWDQFDGRRNKAPRPSMKLPKGFYNQKAAIRFWNSEKGGTERSRRAKAYAKLSQAQIDDIISRVQSGERRQLLAQEYDVSVSVVSKYVLGKYVRRD